MSEISLMLFVLSCVSATVLACIALSYIFSWVLGKAIDLFVYLFGGNDE